MSRRISFVLTVLTALLVVLGIEARATNREDDQGPITAPKTDEEKKKEAADAIAKVKSACHYSESETDPKQVDKQTQCVNRAIAAQRRKMYSEKALQATFNQVYGVT